MERLTSNVDYCETYCENNKNSCHIYSSCINRKSYELTKVYEDAEEQGLFLKLPCKVDDTAYYVHREYCDRTQKWTDRIDEVIVDSFVLNVNLFVNVSLYIGGDRFGKTLTPYKTLFFTKEEAEQALADMQEV